jgi:hypothetical protein
MSEIDLNWIKEQLTQAKTKRVVGDSVLSLLNHVETLPEMSESDFIKTIEVFSRLSLGHALVKENKNEVWIPVVPGQIRVADEVRVRSDAFSGSTGTMHNGRRGRVVAVRYGDVIFKSTDGKQPVLDGAHYPPNFLEKLVN